jgi:hypothetical protein
VAELVGHWPVTRVCREFDLCRRCPRGVAVDFDPKQSGWLMHQLGNPSLSNIEILIFDIDVLVLRYRCVFVGSGLG